MKLFTSIILSLVVAGPLTAQDVRSGIVAYWPLDGLTPDGLRVPEQVNGADLTLVNMSAGNVVAGMRGNAMSFDGVSQLLWRDTAAGPNPGLPLHANLRKTICLWVKGNGVTQLDKRIFAEASMTSTTPLFNLGTDNLAGGSAKLDLYIRNDTATPVNHIKTAALALNNVWHHVAVTDDNGAVRFYVDGVLDTTTVTYTKGTAIFTTLSIGAIQRLNGAVAFFNGAVDDVAVWNRVLSVGEIQNVMNNGIVTPIPALIGADRLGPYLQGARVKLTAELPGKTAVSWQWKRNGSDIAGATAVTYVIPSLTTATAGDYSVVINGTETSAALALAFTADPAAALTTNLVSWWGFNTLNETTIPPTTPDPWGGHPLTCQDMDAINLVPGQFGNAFQFDGFFEMAYRTTGFPISSNAEYSIALWVKADGTVQSDLRVFAEGSKLTNTPLVAMGTAADGSNHLRMYIRSDSNTVALARDTEGAVFDNNWHHVVWTDRNGAGRLYVDGLQDGASFNYTRTGQTFTLDQTSVGGILRAAGSNFLNGQVDDVAVWNRALTWTEIQQLKNTGVPAPVAAVKPTITVQPIPRTLWAGRSVTLSVQATGTAPFTYEWYKGVDLVGGVPNAPTLVIDPAQVSNSGSYTCKVSNSAGNETSAAAVVTVRAITNIDSGRISCWPLDAGTTSTPDILAGYDMTLNNIDVATAFRTGVKNKALFFDGVDDLLVRTRSGIGTDIPLTTREEFTVSFWVQGSGMGQSDRRIFSESSTANANALFNMGTETTGSTQSLSFYIRSDGGGVPVNHLNSLVPVLDGAWHHVTYSDYKGQGQLFVDGNPDLSLNYARPVSTFTNVSIGGIARATPSHWFAGGVDEVCTWERALSFDEAFQLFQSQPRPVASMAVSGMTVLAPGDILQLTVDTTYGNVGYYVESTTAPGSIAWAPEFSATVAPVSGGQFTVQVPLQAGGRKFFRVVAP